MPVWWKFHKSFHFEPRAAVTPLCKPKFQQVIVSPRHSHTAWYSSLNWWSTAQLCNVKGRPQIVKHTARNVCPPVPLLPSSGNSECSQTKFRCGGWSPSACFDTSFIQMIIFGIVSALNWQWLPELWFMPGRKVMILMDMKQLSLCWLEPVTPSEPEVLLSRSHSVQLYVSKVQFVLCSSFPIGNFQRPNSSFIFGSISIR